MRWMPIAAAAMIVALTACSGAQRSSGDDQSPKDRLSQAKESFDDADYIGFTLSADELPAGTQGLVRAEGTGTHEPAFTGEVQVETTVDLNAPLIAVSGAVYAQLPFVGWSRLDPADYGAPDPADLMDSRGGISSLFTASGNLSAGAAERDGEEVLTTINGTLPSAAVDEVFPSVGASDFTVTYTLTDSNDVRSVRITGPFYDGSPDVTYTIDLNLDAAPVDIEAPS
jgi:lipoprotein LprG